MYSNLSTNKETQFILLNVTFPLRFKLDQKKLFQAMTNNTHFHKND